MPGDDKKPVQIWEEFERNGFVYTHYTKPCSGCGQEHHFVARTGGARTSCFQISAEDAENLHDYIDRLDETFATDVEILISSLKESINEVTVGDVDMLRYDGENNSTYKLRLLDKARLILREFSENDLEQRILQNVDDPKDDVVAAFLLGYLASENWWTTHHEDAVFEGYAHIEGREAGRPKAVEARRRLGKRSRGAIVAAAKEIMKAASKKRMSDRQIAREIGSQRIDKLRKKDGTYLGDEAITKHIREARKLGLL